MAAWWTVREVATELRVSEVTVQRWLRAGTLRGTRLGGTKLGWRIPAWEVERLLRVPEKEAIR